MKGRGAAFVARGGWVDIDLDESGFALIVIEVALGCKICSGKGKGAEGEDEETFIHLEKVLLVFFEALFEESEKAL